MQNIPTLLAVSHIGLLIVVIALFWGENDVIDAVINLINACADYVRGTAK